MTRAQASSSQVEDVQRQFLVHAGLLRGFIHALVPDHSLAEDVFQETFLTVTRKASDFAPGTSFLSWARSVARLHVYEACRKHKGRLRALDPEVLEAVAASAEEVDDSWAERRQALARCLPSLAPRAREILDLRYSKEFLSPPQIAARLSWTVGAVHVALARARKFLQECVQRRLNAGEATS